MFQIPQTNNGNIIASTPILCKILIIFNVAIWVSTLIMPSLMQGSCLSPYRVMNNFESSYLTLWTANFYHSNPLYSGPMGIFHIILNMMTLYNVGGFLEKKLGTFGFGGVTLFLILIVGPMQLPLSIFTQFITQDSISLLSTRQCGIGYSGILFGYFMAMLKLTPGETSVFCGMTVKKWIQPLLQLILLSFLINASFIGHLSGIVCGIIYIMGFPGFFQQRQQIIKSLENINCIKFLTKRNDFIVASQQPYFDHFNIKFFMPSRSPTGNTYNQLSRADALGGVTGRSLNNNNNNSNNNNHNMKSGPMRGSKLLPSASRGSVEMTIVNGVLVPKSSVVTNNNHDNSNNDNDNGNGNITTQGPDGI